MEIKAVLFDLGGTLVKTSPISEVIKKILAVYGVERSAEKIEQARKAAE
jgi:beta-phosphoglucomutase-like phosphatase (HAD superfamily)